MSKILKGWELLKEIAEGKIKEGTKINMRCPQYEMECEYCNKTLYDEENEEICVSTALACEFELIEDQEEIDIQDIQNLELDVDLTFVECGFVFKMNELILAIKQLDNKIKESK